MALATGFPTSVPPESDQPNYAELVRDGYEIARKLGLSMSERNLTVKSDVIAGRLGHLRLLIDAWPREKRERALREEHAQVLKPKLGAVAGQASSADSIGEAFGEGNESARPSQEPETRRFRKGKEALSKNKKVRFTPSEIDQLEEWAAEERIPLAALIRRTVRDHLQMRRYAEANSGPKDEEG